jgi:DNA-binding phage protein
MLRNVVNASCGFAHLGKSLNINSKSLMRMLSASGNPKANHLFKIIGFLLKNENVRLNITKRAA